MTRSPLLPKKYSMQPKRRKTNEDIEKSVMKTFLIILILWDDLIINCLYHYQFIMFYVHLGLDALTSNHRARIFIVHHFRSHLGNV